MYICKDKESNESSDSSKTTGNHMSVEEEQKYYINNLNKVCRILFCNFGCWHACLENVSSNPFTSAYCQHVILPCQNHCPYYDNSRLKYIKPANKRGLQSFLASMLMSNHNESYSPTMLVKKLLE